MTKRELRASLKALLRELPPEDLATRSRAVGTRLIETPAWKRAECVLCFLSMPEEIDTGTVIEAARREGKALAVPRIEEGDLVFVLMPPESARLERDRWGIPVPAPDWQPLDASRAGVILVAGPGLAFDRAGNRLGRGKGYYDRFLPRLKRAAKDVTVIGLCLSEQVLPEVPHESYDQKVDGIVTERETILLQPSP